MDTELSPWTHAVKNWDDKGHSGRTPHQWGGWNSHIRGQSVVGISVFLFDWEITHAVGLIYTETDVYD